MRVRRGAVCCSVLPCAAVNACAGPGEGHVSTATLVVKRKELATLRVDSGTHLLIKEISCIYMYKNIPCLVCIYILKYTGMLVYMYLQWDILSDAYTFDINLYRCKVYTLYINWSTQLARLGFDCSCGLDPALDSASKYTKLCTMGTRSWSIWRASDMRVRLFCVFLLCVSFAVYRSLLCVSFAVYGSLLCVSFAVYGSHMYGHSIVFYLVCL